MARSASVNTDQVHELLLQALETERGGIQIYTAALKAAVNDDLKKEWSEYLEETRTHEQVLTRVFEQLGIAEAMQPKITFKNAIDGGVTLDGQHRRAVRAIVVI